MTERTRIGTLFGAPGMYVSQPGDNLLAPTRPLLFDSRYDGFEIHAAGRVSMPMIDNTSDRRTYSATVSYPNLGYIPQVTWAAIANGSSIIHYNSTVIEPTRGSIIAPTDAALDVGPSQLTYRPTIFGGSQVSLDLFYIIYRNPRVTPTYTPAGTERVFIGNDGGTFKMRVSKPGFHARFATRDQCLVHEESRKLIPVLTGVVGIPARPNMQTAPGRVSFYLGRAFSFPPKIVVTSGANSNVGVSLGLNDGLMELTNSVLAPVTARYVIYHPE